MLKLSRLTWWWMLRGRGSRLDDWLQELGYPAPTVDLVEVGMGYSTRFYRREPHHLNGDLIINIAPTMEYGGRGVTGGLQGQSRSIH